MPIGQFSPVVSPSIVRSGATFPFASAAWTVMDEGWNAPDVGDERIVRRVRTDLRPVAVVGGDDLVVRFVEVHTVRIFEAGRHAADGPQWRLASGRGPAVDRNGIRLLHGNRDFVTR
ncbi:MAG: hypothetical protein DMF92_17575 [Acidobacteria bacterium]|nr:MAG: hypothetical protein DMF92_17575 [Acidobacteriota bacterium]